MPFSPVKWPAMAQKWFKFFFSIFPCFLTQKDMIIGGVEIVHSKIQFLDPYTVLMKKKIGTGSVHEHRLNRQRRKLTLTLTLTPTITLTVRGTSLTMNIKMRWEYNLDQNKKIKNKNNKEVTNVRAPSSVHECSCPEPLPIWYLLSH